MLDCRFLKYETMWDGGEGETTHEIRRRGKKKKEEEEDASHEVGFDEI